MAMEYKDIVFDVFDSGDIAKYPAFNPRAEVPILVDGDVTVRNSATILDYLERRFDGPALFPADPAAFATAKEWELTADTMVDPIVVNVALWLWAEMPPMPEGLLEAAQRDITAVYDRLEKQLDGKDFIAGGVSAADFALYPQLHGAQASGLAVDGEVHRNVAGWLERMKQSDEGKSDFREVVRWWKSKDSQDVETDKINWGTYRLEWFLANGFHDFFLREIENDRVLWSVGPNNNARNSPLFAERA
jgi:glutathione S-transferase